MSGRGRGSGKGSAAAAASKPARAPRGRGAGESSLSPGLGAGPAEAQAAPEGEGSGGRGAPLREKEGARRTLEPLRAGRGTQPQEAGQPEGQEPGRGAPRKGGRAKKVATGAGAEPVEGEPGDPQPQRDEAGQARADVAAPRRRAAAPARSLREVLETLVLPQKAVSEASKRVNRVMELLVAAIQKDPHFSSIEKLGTGSYYEKLKISKPDEFDIMLKLPKLRFDLEPYDASASAGAFYSVKLKRNPGKESLNDFLDGNETLSAFKMLAAIRNIIIKEVKKIEEEKVQVERKKRGCPAVTLRIGEHPSAISVDIIFALEGGNLNQCKSTKGGLNIERWLGIKVKRDFSHEPLCLVPKNVKDGKCLRDCWRLSFSHIEKVIVMNHGNEKTCCEREGRKCCRKACLKLLKYLLELLKTKHENRNQFDKFCSYHAKTAFFHACVKWPHDSEWLETDLDDCFEKFLDFFLDCLRNADLRHFFIPEFNFFSTDRIETAKCKALAKVIESERNNRFPIFFLKP